MEKKKRFYYFIIIVTILILPCLNNVIKLIKLRLMLWMFFFKILWLHFILGIIISEHLSGPHVKNSCSKEEAMSFTKSIVRLPIPVLYYVLQFNALGALIVDGSRSLSFCLGLACYTAACSCSFEQPLIAWPAQPQWPQVKSVSWQYFAECPYCWHLLHLVTILVLDPGVSNGAGYPDNKHSLLVTQLDRA